MYEDILGDAATRIGRTTRVALMMSGGVDSTILYWALHQASLVQHFDLTLYTIENTIGYEDNVARIRRYLAPTDNRREVWVNAYSAHGRLDGNIDVPIRNVLLSQKHDMVFTGATKNPPFHIDAAPVRMTKAQTDLIPTLVCPFIDKTKDFVFAFYLKYGLMELYRLTHSCTRVRVGECGECFQCVEKRWSEHVNNYDRSI